MDSEEKSEISMTELTSFFFFFYITSSKQTWIQNKTK